ncbi:universal stress protein [Fructobacillus ficulneus]|uniref:Universal stress protein UspA n=1 Tax=Fructobacillus ficulneus TaxID=157463 RepID=A0A0K8MGS4_9LACO|nr:universal stress protein [Fructobacillus ficulneus]GAO99393.1 universal stress protein UspA [Fructobacillus ficulneus]
MTQTYRNILVPVDGSKEAEAALQRAVLLAQENDQASLTIATVIDTRAIQNISSFDSTVVDTIAEESHQTLETYKKQAETAGVKNVAYRIDYGTPKTMVANDIPTEINADLIVIGATGLNTVERIVVGSVTAYVTRTAKTDVLVVR